MGDNSALTERGTVGIFYDALERAFERSWASKVGLVLDADAEVMPHRFAGAVPQMREWVGGINVKALLEYQILARMKDYEASVSIRVKDLRRDKTGHLRERLDELAAGANVSHWERLLVALIEANPPAYDGVAFFSTAHSHGESGTLRNILTSSEVPALNVGNVSAPTKDEASAILTGVVTYASKMKDDAGRFANRSAREWLVLVPPAYYMAFAAAAKQEQNESGGDNVVQAIEERFEVVKEPMLDDLASDTIYVFRMDAPSSRPFLLHEEVAPFLDILGESSDYAKTNGSVLYMCKSTRNVTPGEFKQAFKATLS